MRKRQQEIFLHPAYLDIAPFMITARLTEQPVRNHLVYIEHIQDGVGILRKQNLGHRRKRTHRENTLDRLAVKTTISYFSPILRMNSSTPGRLST